MCEEDVADFNPAEDDKNAEERLATQELSKLNLSELSPITPEIMSRQATINIGTIGHVAHGKSTVVKAMSGVKTTKFKREAVMNITIHLGYANAKIFKCGKCESPQCFRAAGSGAEDTLKCSHCQQPMQLMRHVSFVDCPGHDILMATMLNGAAIMDAALLLIAANEPFPQPQTLEHLKAVEIMQLGNIIVLQNKIDIVKREDAKTQYDQIRAYLRNTVALNSPIIPISAQLGFNIDIVLEYICSIPLPLRQFNVPARMIVIRSFDVNKPSEDIDSLKGGVAGGSLQRGILKIGQEIEVRPGLIMQSPETGVFSCQAIRSRAVSILAENNHLQYAIPGGLIGIGTTIDPSLTRQNKLVGQLIGDVGSLPEVYSEIEVLFHLLPSVVGVKAEGGASHNVRIAKLADKETLQINVGSLTAGGTVLSVRRDPDIARIQLLSPVCCKEDDMVAISRRFDRHWRLIGWGKIRRGAAVEVVYA